MKKFFFFTIAVALLAVSCSKTEVVTVNEDSPIAFQVANYAATKVTGSVFPQDDTFGTYAWTAGTTTAYFIGNEEVSYNATHDAWTTTTPYYWPKDQAVDFFSYYPYDATGAVPAITSASKITYSNIDYTAHQIDYMYADKAVGFTDNANQVDDGTQSGRGGVPTFFRHAGSKVTINVILGENEKTETVTGTKTKWEVELLEVVLSGIYTKGSCELNLSSTDNGVIAWTKPSDNAGYHVWSPVTTMTNDTNSTLYKNVQHYNLSPNQGQQVIGPVYMLPQTLAADQQKITLKVNIKAYRKTATETDYPADPYMEQNNKIISADLLINTGEPSTSVLAWQMNQAITYNITLGPAGQQITFDPAVDAWDAKNYSTNIDISLDI